MCLNTYTDHNPDAPWNQEELPPLSELEQLQEDYGEMRRKYEKLKEDMDKLAVIHQAYLTFGNNTNAEMWGKNEILNKYINKK
jgi:hypothetical protein